MQACNNKRCCNPVHLSSGDQSRNMTDAYAIKRCSSPMSRELVELIRKSDKTAKQLSVELGLNYTKVYKVKSGMSFNCLL